MTFTLAHLSDPHLAPLPQPRWSELIGKRVTGYINWQRKRRFIHDGNVLAAITTDMEAQKPDHIAVTGDIANIALPDEFSRGRKWLDSLGAPADVSYVPGNHDIYVPSARAQAARQWAPFMSDDAGIAGFPYVRRRGPLALIGLSSGVPTAPFRATGRIGEKQLSVLAAMLRDLAGEDLFRVLMIHHPPVTMAKRHKRLLDAAALLQVIAKHGAELLIHGHDHLDMVNWLEGPNGTRVPAIGVPSASARPGADKNDAAYHLYRVDGAPGAWHCQVVSRGMGADSKVAEQNRFMVTS